MNLNVQNLCSSDEDQGAQDKLKDGACLIAVEVRGSTGEKTIPDSSAYIAGDVLKNENVGKSSIRWVPKDVIRFRSKINQAAQRLLNEKGVSYYGGATLLPMSELEGVERELEELQDEFQAETLSLKMSLDKKVDRHKADNPEIASLVDRFREPAESFVGRFQFSVVPPTTLDFINGTGDGAKVVKDMTERLIDEVAKDAAALYKKTWMKCEKVTGKTLRPLEVLRKKLQNLSFMDDSIVPIADAFEAALSEFPKDFPVKGEPVLKLSKFVATVSDPDNLRAFGQATNDNEPEAEETAAEEEQSSNISIENSVSDVMEDEAESNSTDESEDVEPDLESIEEHNINQEQASNSLQLNWGEF